MPAATFCTGLGITMGSGGLQLPGADPEGDCVMLWTDALAVNSLLRAVAANFGVCFLALVAQFLIAHNANKRQRSKTYAKRQRALAAGMRIESGGPGGEALPLGGGYASTGSTMTSASPVVQLELVEPVRVGNLAHAVDSLEHGARIAIAYLLMLAAMTYDAMLLLSIVVGFTIGFFVFTKDTTKVPESADPCCS